MARNIKQVIIIRKDLNMRKGKLAAQVAHASMKAVFHQIDMSNKNKWVLNIDEGSPMDLWLNGIFTKIVVYVNSEEELMEIADAAARERIIGGLIQDAGKTEFHDIPTYTALALGPEYSDKLDKITGHLPLM